MQSWFSRRRQRERKEQIAAGISPSPVGRAAPSPSAANGTPGSQVRVRHEIMWLSMCSFGWMRGNRGGHWIASTHLMVCLGSMRPNGQHPCLKIVPSWQKWMRDFLSALAMSHHVA